MTSSRQDRALADSEKSGIAKKFEQGCLTPHEWLTQDDLHAVISKLKLEEKGIQIVQLDAEKIGVALHQAREKHQLDTKPYVIPLIIDLGEDEYSRRNSRGSHWSRCFVTIDPRERPPLVSVEYTDPLALPDASQKKIREILTNALRYHQETGSLSEKNLKVMTAFPECVEPSISISGSRQPQEGYTSGYQILLGLAKAFKKEIDETVDPRDFIYRQLIESPELEGKLTDFRALEQKLADEKKIQAILFDIPEKPTHTFTPTESFSVSTLLKYIAENESMFSSFQYDSLSLENASLEDLQSLTTQLKSIPFRTIYLTFNMDLHHQDLTDLITRLNELGIDRLVLKLPNANREIPSQFVKDKAIMTMVSLKPRDITMENTILSNRRQKMRAHDKPLVTSKEKIQLGPIGKALFQQDDLSQLAAEVQIQEQQQQQVQQQMQSTTTNDDLPDEDELLEESFLTYSGTEELLDRDQFIDKMKDFIAARHPTITPARCWDLITGKDSVVFRYGIKAMTLAAAKKLIENLVDVQYGLNLDNLPEGFYLQEDKDKKLVMAYDGLNPPLNPKESPLTIRFTKPKLGNEWQGSALQFINEEEAIALYKAVFKPGITSTNIKEKALKSCEHFFYLKEKSSSLTIDHRLLILETFAHNEGLKQRIASLFGKELTIKNIAALSEILYEQGATALSYLIDDLEALKRVKGEAFFKSFKACFIDPLENLNELTTAESKTAMLALQAQSPAESAWWTSLTEQHSSNLKYSFPEMEEELEGWTNMQESTVGQRYANLAELNQCFTHFCTRLIEMNPPLTLTPFCPLKNVADMRVGLDRLTSTILPNAHDVNEQFYESLDELDLGPLGAFYASRYEGFKLVSSEMALDIGYDFLCQENFHFRLNKAQLYASFLMSLTNPMKLDTETASKAIFLRYLATFNQRAPISFYKQTFDELNKDILEAPGRNPAYFAIVFALIDIFGSGKRGKTIGKKEIDTLKKFISKDSEYYYYTLSRWSQCFDLEIKPTLAEILAITDKIIEKHPKNSDSIIKGIVALVRAYTPNSDIFLNALVVMMAHDASALPLKELLPILENLSTQKDIKTQAEMTSLLAICRHNQENSDELNTQIQELFRALTDAPYKNDMIELLKNIDVERSEVLPTLGDLHTLIVDIKNQPPKNYNDLLQRIETKLPQGCVINKNAASTTAPESTGNLHTILSKQMGELIEAFSPYKAVVGEAFLENLKTPQGPAILMDKLDELKNLEGMQYELVRTKVIEFMKRLYDSMISNSITRIGVKGKNLNAMTHLLRHRINHPVNTTTDFKAFIDCYPREIASLENFTAQLKTLHEKWPNHFGEILMPMNESDDLGSYSIAQLVQITKAFATGFDRNQPFPTTTFREFFSYHPLNEKAKENISTMIDMIFNGEENPIAAGLNQDEKQRLCIMAIQYGKKEDNNVADFLTELLSLKEKQPELYQLKLALIQKDPSQFRLFIDNLNFFNDPQLSSPIITFFSKGKGKAEDDLEIMKKIRGISPEKQAVIFRILIKASQKGDYKKEQFMAHIDLLNETNDLKALEAIYSGTRYPSLEQLNKQLSKENLDLKTLQEQFDRDPHGKRADEDVVKAQFNTEKVASLIDKMRDINQNRPLLYTQRRQLQDWFLYINAIGNRLPILTQDNAQKSVRELSHVEINALLDDYRTLQAPIPIKKQLEVIAILREVMYRSTGNFPRPTQILYLLNALQNNGNFVAQIPTGQGKSMTSALAAAFMSLNGKTVDITSSNLFLASESLKENQEFFDYLHIPTKLIEATDSKREDYQKGGIYYSSMSDIALYRSKMKLIGKEFPKDTVIIADEIDFSTLDDNTRYRFAKTLDPVTDPYQSPYTWAYEALIRFADTQGEALKSDEELLSQAKVWLKTSAKSKEQQAQIKSLEENPAIYEARLKTWLIAAGRTRTLIKQLDKPQDAKFRIVRIDHKRKGQVSKACILSGGRPSIEAEYSNAVQQFLHVRLREKYREEIQEGTMPDFLVEPEKVYVSSLNSKILMSNYERILGMTGTAGSEEEIKEQHEKYNFQFIDIPPHVDSRRVDLSPKLTNKKFFIQPKDDLSTRQKKRAQSAEQHIRKIVAEIIHHASSGNPAGPILITCADKKQGERINEVLQEQLSKRKLQLPPVQRYYSSEKSSATERTEEENSVKKQAGENGQITISTVFGRGTDIKPKHKEGLYTLKTYVDTQPHSVEDLERAKRQEIGRSARGEDKGKTRLMIDRNQFVEIPAQEIEETNESLEQAIRVLNQKRNIDRRNERLLRESFDSVKEELNQVFQSFVDAVHKSSASFPEKSKTIDTLLAQWSQLLNKIDDQWESLSHNHLTEDNLISIIKFSCTEWSEAVGSFTETIQNLPGMTIPSPVIIGAQTIVDRVQKKHPPVSPHYVKREAFMQSLDPNRTSNDVYSEMADAKQCQQEQLSNLKSQKLLAYINRLYKLINTAYRTPTEPVADDLKLRDNEFYQRLDSQKIKPLMEAILYLRYKAHRDGNLLAEAELGKHCRELMQTIAGTDIEQKQDLLKALAEAQQQHFIKLTNHQGKHESRKVTYLRAMAAEWNQILGESVLTKNKNNLTIIKQTFEKALIDYKDKAWFVSKDRKRIAGLLINDLKQINDSKTLLEKLTVYRNALLVDDLQANRDINAGLSGRLYQMMDHLRAQIIAASDSTTVDSFAENELADVRYALKAFAQRMNYAPLNDMILTLNNDQLIFEERYHALTRFFTEVNAYAANPKLLKDKTIHALAFYCQNKQTELVQYCQQCKKHKTVNKPQSVEVFQAASHAATNLLETRQRPLNKKETLGETIQYRNQAIPLSVKISYLNWHPEFKKIHTHVTYQKLLSEIERKYVEQSKEDSKVQFLSISVEKNQKMGDNILQIVISLNVNDKPYNVAYLINLDSQLVYIDAQEAIVSEAGAIGHELSQSSQRLETLRHQTDKVVDSINASHSFKKRLQGCRPDGDKASQEHEALFPKPIKR